MVGHPIERFGIHSLGLGEIADQPRIEVTTAGSHGNARCRGEAHRGIDAAAVMDGRETGAVSQMREHQPTGCRLLASDAVQFPKQMGV